MRLIEFGNIHRYKKKKRVDQFILHNVLNFDAGKKLFEMKYFKIPDAANRRTDNTMAKR